MLKDWDACAREVGRALSRYDGHTTYAKLETILGVPASGLFEENPSCYAAELISEVEKQNIGRIGAQAHLRHGISLGFLERVTSVGGIQGGGRKTKIDETARIALSPLGRAYRAAGILGNSEFRRFLVVRGVLDGDFDIYGLFLKSALENSGHADLAKFGEQVRILLRQREQWLEREIPVRPVRERVSACVSWVRRGISETSVRHHFNMRRQWAESLSHIDKSRMLTDVGNDVAARVASAAERNSMFWLAPSPECVKKMGGNPEGAGSVSSAWDLFRPNAEESAPEDEMVRAVAEFMGAAFNSMRLRVFAQAPLAAVIPYVHFQESRFNRRVDLRGLFEAVLRQHRDVFRCMLTAIPAECHYQLQASSSARPGAL